MRLEWVSAAEGGRFAQLIKEFVEDVKKVGPSPLRDGSKEKKAVETKNAK